MKEYIIPGIDVRVGSIVTLRVDAIVNPANSFGYMGGGVAAALKKLGGESIEEEAIAQAPIQVGEAVVTGPGDLACKKVIHAPTMHNPGERTDASKVADALGAALDVADAEGMKVIAVPGMGTGTGGLPNREAAKTMVACIKAKKFTSVERIILVAMDEDLARCFEDEIRKQKK